MENSFVNKFYIACASVILFVVLALSSVVTINAGERGVLLTFGAFDGKVLDAGFHLKIPLIQKIKKINVRVQNLAIEKSQAYTKDLQMVDIVSLANYSIKPEMVGDFYVEYGGEFVQVLTPRLESSIKQTISKYNSEELLQKRGSVQAEIFESFKASVPDVVNLISYSLVDESFTDEYEGAIERKQVAQQEAETAQNKLKQVEFEAEQRKAEARGEAEAIRIQAQAITQQGGKEYVRLKTIEKWSGNLPTYMIPGAILPFLGNLNQTEY